MSAQPLTVRSATPPECRSCNTSVPVDEHFCPNCSRIQSLGRHGDYFAFLGLPRQLVIDAQDLDRRFRDLSRKFHPDFYYNATPAERLASLERSSYLNDAYRAIKQPVSRIEHLLTIEGLPMGKSDEGTAKVPPGLLEEVFALNEELDEIRDLRESGADAAPRGQRTRCPPRPPTPPTAAAHRPTRRESRPARARWRTPPGCWSYRDRCRPPYPWAAASRSMVPSRLVM